MATDGAAARMPANRLGLSVSDSAANTSTSAPPSNDFATMVTTACTANHYPANRRGTAGERRRPEPRVSGGAYDSGAAESWVTAPSSGVVPSGGGSTAGPVP